MLSSLLELGDRYQETMRELDWRSMEEWQSLLCLKYCLSKEKLLNKENKKYILIHSASGGGSSAIVARYLGYEKVIGTCSKKKRRYALEMLCV